MNLPRAAFPAFAETDYAYLNSGGSGPPTSRTLGAMRTTDDFLSGPAYREGIGLYDRQRQANDRARDAAARLLATDPANIALTTNTSQGMSLGAFALDWREGDEIVSSLSEHPGCLVPLHAVADRYGAKIKLVEPPITTAKVSAAVGPKTRLVALSHVDWTSGAVLPLAGISAVARERGAVTLVDGAQSVGNIAVDVQETGADMYAFTGHKWVLGPEGLGAFYVRPGLEVGSTNLGYMAIPDPATFDSRGGYALHEGARRFESSTTSPAMATGFATAAEAVHERGAEGFEGIRRRADLLMKHLAELPNVTLRSPKPAASGLVSFEVRGHESKAVAERLLEKGFVVRHLPQPFPYVRASTHLFNTDAELEALADTVSRL